MKVHFEAIAVKTGRIKNIRMLGGMIAGDLIVEDEQIMGRALSREALALGVLLRPLGNTLYWFPPLTTKHNTIDELALMTQKAIESVFNK